jgi:hypothetical protein
MHSDERREEREGDGDKVAARVRVFSYSGSYFRFGSVFKTLLFFRSSISLSRGRERSGEMF